MPGVVFLDLKKVFDLVDHDILLKKYAIYLTNSSSLSFKIFFYHIFLIKRDGNAMALTPPKNQ